MQHYVRPRTRASCNSQPPRTVPAACSGRQGTGAPLDTDERACLTRARAPRCWAGGAGCKWSHDVTWTLRRNPVCVPRHSPSVTSESLQSNTILESAQHRPPLPEEQSQWKLSSAPTPSSIWMSRHGAVTLLPSCECRLPTSRRWVM